MAKKVMVMLIAMAMLAGVCLMSGCDGDTEPMVQESQDMVDCSGFLFTSGYEYGENGIIFSHVDGDAVFDCTVDRGMLA